MTDTTNTTEAVDEQLEAPRRRWFRMPLVRRSALDEALDMVDELNDEAMHWIDGYTHEGERADKAETRADQAEERLGAAGDRVAALDEQVEELSRRLAEVGTEAAHMNRSFRAVCEERDELRTLLRAVEHPYEPQPANGLADALQGLVTGQVGKTPADEADAGLLRDAYRYPHETTHPARVADHLPHCELCRDGLKHLPYADLMAVGQIAHECASKGALELFEAEHIRRQSLSGEARQAIEDGRAQAPADGLEDEERAELLRAAYRYPHDSIPGVVADHLPLCEACVAALPGLADEVLVEMARVQQQIGRADGLLLVLLELEGRGLIGTRSKTSTEEDAR